MRWITAGKDIACASCFTVAFYLAPVFDAAITNANDLGNSYASATNLSLLTALGIWGLSLLLLQFFKEGVRRRIRLGFLFLSVMCVANATVFLWNFGVFDGSRIYFYEHLSKVLLEVLFIISAMIVLTKFRNTIDAEYIKISIGLILITCIPFATQTQAIEKAHKSKISKENISFDLGDQEILNFSKTKNVLVFVIDALQTKFFFQSLENNDSLRKAFQGFTFFINNSGNSPNTTFAVPAMISGVPYTADVPKEKYLKKVFLGPTSLPVIFRKNGYDVRLFTQHTIPYQPGITTWDNIIHDADQAGGVSGWLTLSRLAIYKVAPMPIKLTLRDEKLFARIEAVIVRTMSPAKPALAERFNDAGLIERLIDDALVSNNAPVMRWFHLQGIHHPLTLVSEEEQTNLGMSKGALSQLQTDRFLTKFADMLHSFQRIGIYDDATIIVLGDHGLEDTRMPAMLVKVAGAINKFSISKAPTSNKDLSATLLADAGIEAIHEGKNMFDIDPEETRIRNFYEFFTVDKKTGLPKKVTLQTLKVRQNAPANWINTSTYNPALIGREANTKYIGFTNKDYVDPKRLRGNYERGAAGITWSGWLEIDIPAFDKSAGLVELVYYRINATPKQVRIFVDEILYAEEPTSHYGSFHLLLPAKSTETKNKNLITVRFEFTPNEREKGTLLFVDIISTRLNKKSSLILRPEKTGVNCQLNAVWGAGGDFWEKKGQFIVIADGTVVHAKINAAKKVFSFPLPERGGVKPFEYYLVDATTGSQGPTMNIIPNCQ